jgi:hypothetical protein
MSNELTNTQSNGPALFRASTDAAGLCREIVVATARNIQGRKYVQVEGWQAIAIAHGCVASSGSVERIEGGYRAIGRVIQMESGKEIATAEGFVGDDESLWAKRPEYARRAMAQTRAISRACRSAFAHVVVMMNAGLSTTPAEEVPPEGLDDAPAATAQLDLTPITAANDMGSLKAAFDALNKKHRDADSRSKIAAAKNSRKTVLQQPPGTVIDGETGEVI